MATRSFAAAATVPPPAETPEVVTTLVPAAEKQLASPFAGGQVEGEVDQGDIRLPRINLVQKSGELGDHFTPGSLVFNREILLSGGTEPIELVALRIKKQYQESLPYDPDGPTPRIFNTSAEVTAEGGHFSYDLKDDGNYYREIAHILMVVPCPEKASDDQRDFFIYEFGGGDYALAMWTVTGGAYTKVAKAIFTAATGHLRNGLEQGKWAITSEKKSNGSLTWYAPVIRAAGKTTPEFQTFARSLIS